MTCLPADKWQSSQFRIRCCLVVLFGWGLAVIGLPTTTLGSPWQEESVVVPAEEEEDAADDDADTPATESEVEIQEAPLPVESDADSQGIGHAPGTSAEADPHAAAHEGHHDDHGDHHDEFDLSHANAGPNLLSPADLRFDLAIYTVVVFLLLFAGLYKFAWGPICKGLAIREEGIAAKIEEANVAATRAAEKLREYENRLAAATEESRQIVQKAHQDAQRSSERIIAEAQERADRERVRSLADIEAAKNVALESLSQRAVELAMLMAGRIVRKELTETDHDQLIREALDKLPSRN
jgi:F-type H+-transporting ATPase subunit b